MFYGFLKRRINLFRNFIFSVLDGRRSEVALYILKCWRNTTLAPSIITNALGTRNNQNRNAKSLLLSPTSAAEVDPSDPALLVACMRECSGDWRQHSTSQFKGQKKYHAFCCWSSKYSSEEPVSAVLNFLSDVIWRRSYRHGGRLCKISINKNIDRIGVS